MGCLSPGMGQNLKAQRLVRLARTVQLHRYSPGKCSAEGRSGVKGPFWPWERTSPGLAVGLSPFHPEVAHTFEGVIAKDVFLKRRDRGGLSAPPRWQRHPLTSLLRAMAGMASVLREGWATCPFAVRPSQGTPVGEPPRPDSRDIRPRVLTSSFWCSHIVSRLPVWSSETPTAIALLPSSVPDSGLPRKRERRRFGNQDGGPLFLKRRLQSW